MDPNPAHAVLAAWQCRFAEYTLITQNVDGLHEEAGSEKVLPRLEALLAGGAA